jgi:hypothetical protein
MPVRDEAIHELDEGSWVYLSMRAGDGAGAGDLHRVLVAACEENGWPAVTWSSQQGVDHADSARFFEGMSHAVAHADVVVVVLDGASAMTDAELAFAYRHRRPVLAVRIRDEVASSDVRAMLHGYDRALTISCAGAGDCSDGLKNAFADPGFAEVIRNAMAESTGYV